mgnify:FL=1
MNIKRQIKGVKMKNILKYILAFIIVIAIFLITLTLSCVFPRDWIQENTKESAITLLKQGNPSHILDIRFDNFTDTLMINTAYSIDSSHPFESVLLARRNYLPEKEQNVYEDVNIESNVALNENVDIMTELIQTVSGDIEYSYEYARYWHGYITILRPLLIFFNFNEIRLIIIAVLAMLAIYLLMILSKKISFKYCFVIILSLLVSEYFLMGFTLQGVMTFIISMIASIIICKRFDKIKNIGIYFFVLGMVTCFFDLLTHPIITLGIPMIIYLLIKQEKEQVPLKELIKFIVINTILWGIGYLATNLAKWVIVDAIYNRDLIHKSIMQFFYRSQEEYTSNLAWYDGITSNFIYASVNTFAYYMILIVYAIIALIKNYKNISLDIKSAIPYLIISFMPIAWYLLMRNHALNHMFFTWRGLIVFYLGTGICIFKLLKIKTEKTNEDNVQ